MEHRATTVSLLQDAEMNGTLATLMLQRYLLTGDEAEVPAIRSSAAAVMESLTEARAEHEADGHEERASALRQAALESSAALVFFDEIIELRQSGDVAAAAVEATLPRIQQLGD